MRFFLELLLLLLVNGLRCNNADVHLEIDERIVGGVNACQGEFPALVSLQLDRLKDGVYKHYCGGNILNERWLVTAAHCVDGRSAIEYRIVAGELDQLKYSGLEQFRRVEQIIVHPKFNRSTLFADVALMKVTEPFEFNEYVSPVYLPHPGQQTPPGEWLVIAGWGALREIGGPSALLQKVVVPAVSDEECMRAYSVDNLRTVTTETVFPSNICAGFPEGGRDACYGDSGGPLLNDRYELIGLVSWGEGCAEPLFPGVFTEGDSGGPLLNDRYELIGLVSWGEGCAEPLFPAVFTEVSYYVEWINYAMESSYY